MKHVIFLKPDNDGIMTVRTPAYGDKARPDMTEEEWIQEAIDTLPKGEDGNTVPYRVVNTEDIPSDRVFRDSWEDTGTSVAPNMPKARGIQMNRIREVRNKELAALDITFMRAVEDGDTDAQATIKAKKQELRNIPQTFDLTTDTPEELKEKWPEGLPKE